MDDLQDVSQSLQEGVATDGAPALPTVAAPLGPIRIKASKGNESLNSEQLEALLVKDVMSKFTKWADWRRPMERVWTEIYRLFMTVPTSTNIPTRAKVALPIVFQVVEAALPKIITIVFGQPEWFQAVSRSSNNPVDPQVIVAQQELLRYQLKMAGFFVKFVEFSKSLFLYGTAYFYVYQKVKREWVYERTATRAPLFMDGLLVREDNLTWETKLEYKVIERRPEVENIAIEDVYPDPDARSEEYMDGLFVATSMSKSELKELSEGKYPQYANFDKVEALKGGDKYQEQQFKVDKRSIRGSGEPQRSDTSDCIEIITYWGKHDLDGDGIRENVQLVFADRTVLIKAIRNPFEHQKVPIIRGVMFPVPGEWYGLGLVEPIMALVHELYTVRNQFLDMNNLIINRMWKVATWADVDVDTLVTSPNGFILTGDMDGIEPLVQEPLPGSVIELTAMLQGDIQKASAPESIQGTPSNGSLGRTAKGAQLIITQALEKFGMGAKLIEEMVIVKVLWFFKKLNEQFLDSDETLAYFYGDVLHKQVTPEQLRLDLDFELLGISETVTSEATINQLIALYNLVAARPDIDSLGLLVEIAKKMKLSAPIDQLIKLRPMMPMMPGIATPTAPGAVDGQVGQNGSGAPAAVPQA